MAALLAAKPLCTDKCWDQLLCPLLQKAFPPIPPWLLIDKWAWVTIVFEVVTDNITNDFPCKSEYASHPTSIVVCATDT